MLDSSLKVTGIVGSPRKEGCTSTLVKTVLEGAEANGVSTQLIYLSDLDIAPCKACDDCKSTSRCVQEDDMQVVFKAIEESQGLVIGTPVYFDHVSAQTKIFLDRLYGYVGPEMELSFPPNRKAVLVATWGDSSPTLYKNVLDWLERGMSTYFDVKTVAKIEAPGGDPGPLMNEARTSGKHLVESLRRKR